MIIFLYGADIFRAKEKIEELKRRFLEKNNGNSFLISSIEAHEFDLADFRNKVLSSGFFAEKKIVVLKNFLSSKSEQKDEVLEILKKLPEDTTLIIWEQNAETKFSKTKLFKHLLKEKYVFKFAPLQGNALLGWIRERAAQYNCEIDNESAHLICDILGGDLWKTDLELNKMCAFVGEGGKINKKIVESLLEKEAEENIFKFIDALATKNKRLALICLQNEFEAGANELAVLGMIARQIRILLQTKSILIDSPQTNKQELAESLTIHPYVAQKSLSQVRNFHTNELKNIYRELLKIDMAIKSSSLQARVLFDRMIASL